MNTNEMTSKIKELKELKNMLEELTAEIAAAEDAIKKEMTARGVDELTAGAFKVRWKVVKSSRLDTTAIKKELPELAARFTKITESRRFTVA